MKNVSNARTSYLAGGLFIVIAAVGFYVLAPQLHGLKDSWRALTTASWQLLLAAVVLSFAATFCSALVYYLLSPRRLRLRDTWLVQLAGLFVNRALPGGIGGLGLNFAYLRARGIAPATSTAVVALNNLIGFIGHALLAVVLLSMAALSGLKLAVALPSGPMVTLIALLIGLLAVVVLLAVVFSARLRKAIKSQLHSLREQYRRRPGRLLAAIAASCLLTLCNVLGLWLCCRAVHASVGFVAVFIVFTFGVAAMSATPTPGGLGGAEAALAAGLASQRIDVSLAVAAVLLYRLVSFWIGLPIGLLCFGVVQARHLLNTNRTQTQKIRRVRADS